MKSDLHDNKFQWIEQNPKTFIFFVTILFVLFGDLSITLSKRIWTFFHRGTELRIRNNYYHHDLTKNFHSTEDWGPVKTPIFTNSLGFKDSSNRHITPTTYKHRILFIGDSFTEGIGVPYEHIFSGLYANIKDPSKYEILNAAVASYSPKLYFLKTRYLIEQEHLRFDELFVFIDISDIQDELLYEHFLPGQKIIKEADRSNLITPAFFLEILNNMYSYSLWQNAKKWMVGSRIGNASTSTDSTFFGKDSILDVREKWTDDDGIWERWGKRGAKLAVEQMNLLHELTQQYQIKLRIAVYPWRYQITRRNLNSRQVNIWEEFCRVRGIDFINYFPDFITAENSDDVIKTYFIPGDVHWNAKGHEKIAYRLIHSY